MKIDLKKLASFLVKAKTGTYAASDSQDIKPERPGFKELEFKQGDWDYRDSYCGFFFAPGQEIVRFKGKPIWAMAYSGGMKEKYHGNIKFAREVFGFLKKALKNMNASKPFRGPANYKEGNFVYVNKVRGNIKDFSGEEKIFYKNKEVFRQTYIGGLIIS